MAKISDRDLIGRAASRAGAGYAGKADSALFEEPGRAFFTIAQRAVRWALSQRQVHRFIDSGELSPTRFGRSVRISTEVVAQFEAARLTGR